MWVSYCSIPYAIFYLLKGDYTYITLAPVGSLAGTIMVITWNENFRKLTTSDQLKPQHPRRALGVFKGGL